MAWHRRVSVLGLLLLAAACEAPEQTRTVFESAHEFDPGLTGLQALWARQVTQQLAAGVELDAGDRPAGIEPAATVRSASRRLTGTLEPGPEAARLNTDQDFLLVVETAEPAPVAVVAVAGGMPLHSHGLPTRPLVEALSDGRAMIRGVRFSMPGWWQIVVQTQDDVGVDLLTFDFFVGPGG